MIKRLFLLSPGLFLAFLASARAAVDLVTVPTREGTQLTIYNSEDITMVREHRLLTVKKGVNRIQFSWANTLIDPTSIEFRILDKQDQVDLVDTTFPAGRNEALQWNITSQIAGKIPVEIRYFTSGITWAADYVGIANEDETKLNVTGYVRVFNNSGELYDNAQTRHGGGQHQPRREDRRPGEKAAAGPGAVRRVGTGTGRDGPSGKKGAAFSDAIEDAEQASGKLEEAKEVVKQGLSEYFLFTIEGREDIKDKEPKRLIALKVAEVPLEWIYKLTDRDGGQQFTKFYRFKNIKLLDASGKEKKLSAMENLGLSPLPNGMVRLFSEYKNKDLAYVGGTETKYVPIGDRVEVNVGPDKDITLHRRLKDQQTSMSSRVNISGGWTTISFCITTWSTTTKRSTSRKNWFPASRSMPRWSWSGSLTPTSCCGDPKGSRRTGDSASEAPMSICTRSPAELSGWIRTTSSIFLISSPARSRLCNTKSPISAARRAGTEHRAKARAVVMEPFNTADRCRLPEHKNAKRTKTMRTTITIALAGMLLLAAIPAQARIKLTTLPERESVRIDIQNGRYTLVEEERTVNLQAGRNQVDFSWANIGIDKESIVFRVIKADGDVNVLNTNYPPNENALYWTVSAANAGPAVIRISYLIANMAAEPSYQGVVENDEKKLLMQVYMTVTNTSGESFGETIVQPGVGKTSVRYFNDGERKRMLAAKFAEVPIAKRYVFDRAVDQEKTRMYYRLTNDKENQMGGFPAALRQGAAVHQGAQERRRHGPQPGVPGRGLGPVHAAFRPDGPLRGRGPGREGRNASTMDPRAVPRRPSMRSTVPRFTLDGKESVTKPQFRNLRTRTRYRLQNFKTEKGDPVTVPLTIKEHLDGQWTIEKVVLKEILGERNEQKEKEIPYAEHVQLSGST